MSVSVITQKASLPKAQRCSARRLHERLEGAGYTGAYDSGQRVYSFRSLVFRSG